MIVFIVNKCYWSCENPNVGYLQGTMHATASYVLYALEHDNVTQQKQNLQHNLQQNDANHNLNNNNNKTEIINESNDAPAFSFLILFNILVFFKCLFVCISTSYSILYLYNQCFR